MIKCNECGKEVKMITNSHLRIHGITTQEYLKKYPDAVLTDGDMKKKYLETRYKVERPICAHPECSNLVTNAHNKYCSSRCSMSHRMSGKWRNEQSGKDNHCFTDGWIAQSRKRKKEARERDQHKCCWCGKQLPNKELPVHHLIPQCCFSDPNEAHALNNLLTLCPRCHLKADWLILRTLYDKAIELDKVMEGDSSFVKIHDFIDSLYEKIE